MGNLRASLNPWLGAAGLFFVAVSLFGVTYPATDAWHDQWRDYAAPNATLGGNCSDAANVNNPECDPERQPLCNRTLDDRAVVVVRRSPDRLPGHHLALRPAPD